MPWQWAPRPFLSLFLLQLHAMLLTRLTVDHLHLWRRPAPLRFLSLSLVLLHALSLVRSSVPCLGPCRGSGGTMLFNVSLRSGVGVLFCCVTSASMATFAPKCRGSGSMGSLPLSLGQDVADWIDGPLELILSGSRPGVGMFSALSFPSALGRSVVDPLECASAFSKMFGSEALISSSSERVVTLDVLFLLCAGYRVVNPFLTSTQPSASSAGLGDLSPMIDRLGRCIATVVRLDDWLIESERQSERC
jgi:hypothetical protein